MVRTLRPAAESCCAKPSHTLRSRLHWCNSSTPGPALPAEKYVPFNRVPSGAVRSTACSVANAANAERESNTNNEATRWKEERRIAMEDLDRRANYDNRQRYAR